MKWYDVIPLVIAVAGATACGIVGNWAAMVWAIATGLWVINASLRSR